MEIVYCGGCGKVLREDDFSKGLAQVLDNRPWCLECRPPDKKPITSAIPTQRKAGSSAKHPRVNPGTARRETPSPSRNLLIAGGVAVVAVVLAVFAMASNTPAPTPMPSPPPKRGPDPPPANAGAEEAARLLKELDSFASLAPADKILARCEEIRSRVKGTPSEARFKTIEAAAVEQKKAREQETQAARELEAIQKLIDDDPRFDRFEEVVRRLRAAKQERRIAEYETARKLSPHLRHTGPFDSDEDGFLRNWLILGVFPNDGDKGLDTDFLKDEPNHDPVAGKEVGKVKWAAFASPQPRISFYDVPHLGIKNPKDNIVAYAACLVQVPVDVAAEFRVGSDDGCALWIDGNPIGKVHKSRSYLLDNDRYAVPLAPGVHRVLLKVENHSKGFEFGLRIVGPDGKRVPSLRVWN